MALSGDAQYDDGLFSLKQELFTIQKTVEENKLNVAEITGRTKIYANSLANKVRVFEKEIFKKSSKLKKQELLDEENSIFEDFWLFGSEDEEEINDVC